MKVIDLPPYAPTLIESTRAIGYSLEAAVADIIDNSIAAEASEIKISFFPMDNAYISILDNGTGMDSEELDTAMRYGSQTPLETRNAYDLGRFGLGLKTASLSQCRILTVASKRGRNLEARQWNIDFVSEEGKWSLIDLDSEDEIKKIPNIDSLKCLESGTLVVWQDLDRMKEGEINFDESMGRKIDDVRDHLALVYHRYLTGEAGIKKIKIYINEVAVEPKDPFLSKKSDRPMDDEILVINGSKILVRPYILPHMSMLSADELKEIGGKEGMRKNQGFYVYRNKRLLVWGTWFRMIRKGDLSKLARIQVDIPNTLDSLWTLDIKKSYAMPPAEVRKNLEYVIERIAEKSKRKYTVRGKRETSDKTIHLWNRMRNRSGGYYYEINRQHPMVEQLSSLSSESERMTNALLKQIEISLPLNQLYVDLNNDERLVNDSAFKDEDLLEGLRAMLTNQMKEVQKIDFLDRISSIEPFIDHPEVIEKVKREVLEHD